MEPMQVLRQLAYLAVRGRHEEALELAQRTDSVPLYGAPDLRDGMLAPLAGEPRWTALLARSWTTSMRSGCGWGCAGSTGLRRGAVSAGGLRRAWHRARLGLAAALGLPRCSWPGRWR
jgi:hypothetical protein